MWPTDSQVSQAGIEALRPESAQADSTVTSVFTELAMKQAWWAWSCIASQFLGGRGVLSPPKADLRAQGDARDGQSARRILFEHADRLIVVAVHDKPLAAGDGQEGQHVAARQAGDERLLGIDAATRSQVGGGGRSPDRDAGVERPVVVPVVGLGRRSRASPASSRSWPCARTWLDSLTCGD